MADIIVFHYDASPFAEKVRLALGLKGASWRSVKVPPILPRAELMDLTGGYRRIPVMQIGADIFCDTQLILREIDRRLPGPSLIPPGLEGVCYGLSGWTDRLFFQAVVGLIFGTIGDRVPEAFRRDREQMTGRPFDPAAMAAALPQMRDQVRAQIGWLEAQLADGRPYLLGDKPTLADLHAYMPVWFLRSQRMPMPSPAEHPRTIRWAEDLARIGHGTPSPLTEAEAVAIARDSDPATVDEVDGLDPNGRRPGDPVAVMPDDYARTPVRGTLVSSSAQHIALRRATAHAGDVVVHFPRSGYMVSGG